MVRERPRCQEAEPPNLERVYLKKEVQVHMRLATARISLVSNSMTLQRLLWNCCCNYTEADHPQTIPLLRQLCTLLFQKTQGQRWNNLTGNYQCNEYVPYTKHSSFVILILGSVSHFLVILNKTKKNAEMR